MITSLVFFTTLAGATPTLAAPEWNSVNISPAMSAVYAETLADAVRKQGVKVFSTSDIQTLLGIERQKALLGCSSDGSTSCMVELANALGCNATLMVNLARLEDGSFRGLARLLMSSGEVKSSVKLDAPNDRALLDALERAGTQLADPLLPPVQYVKPAISKWWWLPVAVGVVSAGVGVGLMVGARLDYDRVLLAPTRGDAELIARRGSGMQFNGALLIGLGGAAALTGLIFALLPATPVRPSVSLGPSGGSLGLGGTW